MFLDGLLRELKALIAPSQTRQHPEITEADLRRCHRGGEIDHVRSESSTHIGASGRDMQFTITAEDVAMMAGTSDWLKLFSRHNRERLWTLVSTSDGPAILSPCNQLELTLCDPAWPPR